MVQRVAEKLRCPEVDIDTTASIMSIGIDSIAMIGLAADLAELLGRDVDAEIIWEHGSIAALARNLARDDAAADTPSPAEPMKARERMTTGEGPLRLLRNGSGLAPAVALGNLKMATLIKEGLDPQVPVCLIQLDDLFRPPFRIRPVPEMAADFAEQLAQAFPTGPLTLVGYSFGGVVAFDLACQLRSRGREVRLMLLEPARFRREGLKVRIGRHLRVAGELSWTGRVRHVWTKGWGLCTRASTRLSRSARGVLLRRQLDAKGGSGVALTPRDERNLYWEGIVTSLRGYRPTKFTGAAVLAGRPSWLGEWLRTWDRLVEQELELIPLEDAKDHLGVLESGSTTAWIDAVKRWHDGSAN